MNKKLMHLTILTQSVLTATSLIAVWVLWLMFGDPSIDKRVVMVVMTFGLALAILNLCELVDYKIHRVFAGMFIINTVVMFGVFAYLFNYPLWQYTAFTVIAGFAFSILSIIGFTSGFYLVEKLARLTRKDTSAP